MTSVQEIEKQLARAFPPEQAGILAAVIFASYNDLVKAADFSELKDVLRELAGEVKDLAQAQQELARAQQRTEKEIRNLSRQVGGLSEAFGGSLEDFAIDIVPELLEKYWRMEVEDAGRDSLVVNGTEVDFDLVIRGRLDGRPALVLGEAKSNLSRSEAERFILLAEKAGQSARVLQPDLETRIVFFGYRCQKDARDLLKAKGAYMVFTHGKVL